MNYAAGNATVRYDETLLDVADIKVIVHQRGQQSAGESPGKEVSGNKPEHEPAAKTNAGSSASLRSTAATGCSQSRPDGAWRHARVGRFAG